MKKKLDIKVAGSTQTFATTKEAIDAVLAQLKEGQKSSLLEVKVHECDFSYGDPFDGNKVKDTKFLEQVYVGRICKESLINRDGFDYTQNGFVSFINKGCRKPRPLGTKQGIETTITIISK